jgi:hypothetical protein
MSKFWRLFKKIDRIMMRATIMIGIIGFGLFMVFFGYLLIMNMVTKH